MQDMVTMVASPKLRSKNALLGAFVSRGRFRNGPVLDKRSTIKSGFQATMATSNLGKIGKVELKVWPR